MIMESNDFDRTDGKRIPSGSEMRKEFVKGVRRMDRQKEIPDFASQDKAEAARLAAQDMREAQAEETIADSVESTERRSSKGLAWLVGIAAVFAICIMIAGLLGRDDTPLSSRGDNRTAMLTSTSPDSLQFQSTQIVYVSEGTQPLAKAAQAASGQVAKAAVKPAATASSSQAYDDRIEREAREVIHGDFGNNPGRKAALGADYAAVQARVNQILHR